MKCAEAQSLLAPLQDEFAQRYYRWCLEESEREFEADFPSIRAIKSHVAFLFLDFADISSREEIRRLMVSGIKRSNPRAMELTSSFISPEEETVQKKFVAFFRDEVMLQGQRLSSVRMPKRESQIRGRELLGQTSTDIKSKELKQALVKAFAPNWGKPERAPAFGLFSKKLGSWHLSASLDLAGHAQLNYSHLISARQRIDLCPTYLHHSICPMNWCGLQGETSFDLIQTSEIQEVAQTVARFSSRVLQIMPELLSGLEHSLPEEIEDAPQIPLRAG